MRENEKLKKEMQQVLNKERHLQQVEILKEQNQIIRRKDQLSQGHGTAAEANADRMEKGRR